YAERPPQKMLSRGGSRGGATADADLLHAWVARNVERLVEELEFHVVRTGALSVYLMHWDGTEGLGRSTLASPTDRFDLLLDAANWCLQRAWVPGRGAPRPPVPAGPRRGRGAAARGGGGCGQ